MLYYNETIQVSILQTNNKRIDQTTQISVIQQPYCQMKYNKFKVQMTHSSEV